MNIKLHPLTEKIDNTIDIFSVDKLNTIIVEWLKEAASPLRGSSDDLSPEVINECLGLPPEEDLESELAEAVEKAYQALANQPFVIINNKEMAKEHIKMFVEITVKFLQDRGLLKNE